MNKNNEQGVLFDFIRTGLASPEKIRELSNGEVKNAETIDIDTLEMKTDGLFCEKIFGFYEDFEYNSKSGHMELMCPIANILHFQDEESRIPLVLEMDHNDIKDVIYFRKKIVLDAGDTSLSYKQVMIESEYKQYVEEFGENSFEVGIGSEAIKHLLSDIDLVEEYDSLKKRLFNGTDKKLSYRINRKMDVLERFMCSGNELEWMVLDVIPIVPVEARPMIRMSDGSVKDSRLNNIYMSLIYRSTRLNKMVELNAPDIIIYSEKRLLQEVVDCLINYNEYDYSEEKFDIIRDDRTLPEELYYNDDDFLTDDFNCVLKSFTDTIKNNMNLNLNINTIKNKEYVVNVESDFEIHHCGLPKNIAIELFESFVVEKLVEDDLANDIKSAEKMVKDLDTKIWSVLSKVMKESSICIKHQNDEEGFENMPFKPILVAGNLIKLHPIIYNKYNDIGKMTTYMYLNGKTKEKYKFLFLAPNIFSKSFNDIKGNNNDFTDKE